MQASLEWEGSRLTVAVRPTPQNLNSLPEMHLVPVRVGQNAAFPARRTARDCLSKRRFPCPTRLATGEGWNLRLAPNNGHPGKGGADASRASPWTTVCACIRTVVPRRLSLRRGMQSALDRAVLRLNSHGALPEVDVWMRPQAFGAGRYPCRQGNKWARCVQVAMMPAVTWTVQSEQVPRTPQLAWLACERFAAWYFDEPAVRSTARSTQSAGFSGFCAR
ncbi:hypothetical protein VTI74DRAFT_4833 [Chaetomium olivicolor]